MIGFNKYAKNIFYHAQVHGHFQSNEDIPIFPIELLNVGLTQLSNLKVHKRENFLGFDFEICTFS